MKIGCSFLFLLLCGTASNAQTEPTRECGQAITTLTTDEIRSVAGVYLQGLLSPAGPQAVQEVSAAVLGLVQYNVQVTKQCSSCAELVASTAESSFAEYCGTDSYGYDATLSHLRMIPTIDPETGAAFTKTHQLRGSVSMHGTITDVRSGPTEVFPTNMTEFLAAIDFTSATELAGVIALFNDFLSSMLLASAGSIALIPDNIGYGQSHAYNRTYLAHAPYQQAAAVAWLNTRQQLDCSASSENDDDDAPVLENAVTVVGVSEGGYAAVSAAQALDDLGVEVVGLHSFAAPLDPETQVKYLVEVYDTGLYNPNDQLAILPAIAPFLGFAYSQGYEFLHDEEHQILLSPEWSDPAIPSQNVHSWYQAGSTAGTLELLFRAPPYLPEVMNPYILNQTKTALATNSTPCASDLIVPGETDGLCQSLTDNSAHPLLDKVDFPVILCSSPDDTLVPDIHLPPSPYSNPMVQDFVPPIAALTPRGDHLQAGGMCHLGFLATVATASPDAANIRVSASACPTEMPTAMPVADPTTDSSGGVRRVSTVPRLVAGFVAVGLWCSTMLW